MEWKNRYYIRLTQFVFPESVDSLTAELDDLRVNTFSTVKGAQRLAEKLKELYDSSIRMYRGMCILRNQTLNSFRCMIS